MTLQNLAGYGKKFQRSVLGSLLTDKLFLQNVRDVLKEDLFDNSADKWIVQQILKYYETYHCCITMEVLKIEVSKCENEVLKVAVKEELKAAYEASTEDQEYVKEEFTMFCRNQEMKQAILDSTDLLKNGDFEGIRARVDRALKAGLDKNIGHEYKKDIETRYRDDYRPTIPTPWEPINLTYEGGLGPGDLFLIFGGPGAGKTWLCMGIAAYAAELGYNVNYYSLELGESYVSRRIDSYLTGYSVKECAEHRDEVETVVTNLKGNLIVKEYAPYSATMSTIEAHMQKCTDEGHKPDLVIIDYLDYIKPSSHRRYGDRQEEIDDAYIGGKRLAKTWQIPVVSPSQVNRAGAKDSVVEGDKAAGSYNKLAVADGSISLSRMKEDKVLGTARIHIMKSRFGNDGTTFNVKMDANNGHIAFEGEVLPEETQKVNTEVGNFNIDKKTLSEFFSKK